MEFAADLITPVTVLFGVILIGYAIGRIRIGSISLDLSAVLLAAILSGFLLAGFFPERIDEGFHDTLGLYSGLGTSLFVSVIGVCAGLSFGFSSKKSAVYFGTGILTVCGGFLCTCLISLTDSDFSRSMLYGTLCGALTSTPGLSCVLSRADVSAEDAVLGYGSAYLFGTVCTVLLVQFAARRFRSGEKRLPVETEPPKKHSGIEGLLAIGGSTILGEWVGKLSCFGYSLGTTGGILICGIAVGCLMGRFPERKRAIVRNFPVYRDLGLVLFFVGNGVPAGYRLHDGIDLKCFLYGAMITAVSISVGALLCRLLVRAPDVRLSVLAGGMTSTPALGVLVRKEYPVDLSAYSMSYLGALLTATVGMNLLSLPSP